MLERLTSEQEAMIPVVRDEWINLALHSGKQPTREELQPILDWYYSKFSNTKPDICICESPMAMQLAINLMKNKRASVWASVRDSVEDSVGASVRDSVGASVREAVEVGDSVGASVRDSVGASVRASVWASVRDYHEDYCGVGWESWLSFYDYFRQIGILKNEDFENYIKLHKSGVWTSAFFEKIVFICTLPTKVLKDANGRLHSTTEAAVQWKNGDGQYAINGVIFDEKTWMRLTKKKMTPKEAIELKNIEQRTIALKMMGWDIVISSLKAETIDAFKTTDNAGRPLAYALYEIDLKDDETLPARFLKVQWYDKTASKTPKETIIRVNPRECEPTCESARAWTFNLKEIRAEVET